MKSDKRLNPLIGFLVRALLHPQIHYQDPEHKGDILSVPSIIVANHTGHLDGPFINSALKQNNIHSLAAKDRFEQRGFGFVLRHTGCIPIDRINPDTSWIHESLKVLQADKEHIAIYPEGRHGEHRKQLPFHPGVVMLAAAAHVPLVMIYTDGPLKLFHKNHMMVSSPFSLDIPAGPLSVDSVREQTIILQNKMTSLMMEYINISESGLG